MSVRKRKKPKTETPEPESRTKMPLVVKSPLRRYERRAGTR